MLEQLKLQQESQQAMFNFLKIYAKEVEDNQP